MLSDTLEEVVVTAGVVVGFLVVVVELPPTTTTSTTQPVATRSSTRVAQVGRRILLNVAAGSESFISDKN